MRPRAAIAPALARRGTRVVHVGGPRSIRSTTGIDDRPAVLFAEGDRPDALERPRVAVVGTRAATPHGLADARELGAALARAGIVVVSGLAIGIDGAAHEGALDAGGAVIGVVATGLDVVYPRRHGTLYDRVRAHGLIVSEQPFGIGPHPGRFPVRNRIIAALSDVTHRRRGDPTRRRAHHRAARARVRPVGARDPGSRRNPSARGLQRAARRGRAAAARSGRRRGRARAEPGQPAPSGSRPSRARGRDRRGAGRVPGARRRAGDRRRARRPHRARPGRRSRSRCPGSARARTGPPGPTGWCWPTSERRPLDSGAEAKYFGRSQESGRGRNNVS